jgi:hypothetical protein
MSKNIEFPLLDARNLVTRGCTFLRQSAIEAGQIDCEKDRFVELDHTGRRAGRVVLAGPQRGHECDEAHSAGGAATSVNHFLATVPDPKTDLAQEPGHGRGIEEIP